VPLIEISLNAIAITNEFSKKGQKIERASQGWYGPLIEKIDDIQMPAKVKSPYSELLPYDEKPPSRSEQFEELMTERIEIQKASWYLDEYLTIDEEFGRHIGELREHIEEYLKAPTKRPFVVALCGEPGSGKSTLAKSLARAVKCDLLLENAAQWSSIEDLFWLFERVRSFHMQEKRCLVFIDEVDTPVGGEKLYAKLLAPLWDGAYFIRSDERTLGKPTIFVLAGSTEAWRHGEDLLSYSGRQTQQKGKSKRLFERALRAVGERKYEDSKLPDLITRFTTRPITIPKPDKIDLAYLAAFHFRKAHPGLSYIEEGVLRLIADSGMPRHGIRSIEKVVELFKTVKDSSIIRTADLNPDAEKDLTLHIPRPWAKWKSRTDRVEIRE
jgi:hypothetical protein